MGKAGVDQTAAGTYNKNHKPLQAFAHLWAPYVLAERNEFFSQSLSSAECMKAFHWTGELDLNGSTGFNPASGCLRRWRASEAALESQFATPTLRFFGTPDI